MTAELKWAKPQGGASNLTVAFPADVSELLPAWKDIPDEFTHHRGTPWNDLVTEWFFRGLKGNLVPNEGVSLDDAMRHLSACMGSFAPKHEHKEAACAYLMSLWFDRFERAEDES